MTPTAPKTLPCVARRAAPDIPVEFVVLLEKFKIKHIFDFFYTEILTKLTLAKLFREKKVMGSF